MRGSIRRADESLWSREIGQPALENVHANQQFDLAHQPGFDLLTLLFDVGFDAFFDTGLHFPDQDYYFLHDRHRWRAPFSFNRSSSHFRSHSNCFFFDL
jgi:hypothetical protein